MSLTDAQPTAWSGGGKCQLLLKGSQEHNEISSFKNAPLWHCCQPRDRHPWEKCVGPKSPQEPCLGLKHSRSLGLRRGKAGKSKQGMRGPLYTSIRPALWQHTPRPRPPLKCPPGTLQHPTPPPHLTLRTGGKQAHPETCSDPLLSVQLLR